MFQQAANIDVVASACTRTEGGDGFSAQYRDSYHVLWLIAAGTLGNRSMAEDVVQEAALIALGKWEQFTPGTSFTAWMGQVVRHVARNTARKEKRRKAASLSGENAIEVEDKTSNHDRRGAPLVGASGELSRDQEYFDDRVMKALEEVGETARACLLLRTIEGLEYSEISKIVNIPTGTAMSHVHRTRQFLRSKLADMWRSRAKPTESRE